MATPAYLPKRLISFRVGSGARQSYVVRDNLKGQSYDFEPWQFFVLEVLPGCEDAAKLASVFQDRFGYALPKKELHQMLATLADASLIIDEAEKHAVLAPYCRKTYEVDGEQAKQKSFHAMPNPLEASADPAAPGKTVPAAGAPVRPQAAAASEPNKDDTMPAGMQDAVNFDPRTSRWMWTWFNPTGLLKAVAPLLRPLQYSIYALPLLLFGALMVCYQQAHLLEEDVTRLVDGFNFAQHWLLSLLSVNLVVTCTTAVLAHIYRGTVSGFGIALIFGFYPRFTVKVGHVNQLARIERIWLHAAPLLVRLMLFSLSIFVWQATRHTSGPLPSSALAIAVTALIGLVIAGNPLIKSNGYHLLAAFTNEPHLRGKAYKTLISRLRGGTFKEANDLLLAAYAIATGAFMFILILGVAIFVGSALHELQLGGSAIIVAIVVGWLLLRRTIDYFTRVQAAYDRSLQFDRWRKRTQRPDEPGPGEATPPTPRWGLPSYAWRAAVLALLVALFLPYQYRPGGDFVIYPRLQQAVTTDVSGRIEEVFFDGGETVEKGTVLARLAVPEHQAQANIFEKKMNEQQAVIDDLKARPRPEDVMVAKMALSVEKTRADFSRSELKRMRQLARDGVAPQEELEEAEQHHAVNLRQVEEKRAALKVAERGPTEYEIAAAEAKLESLAAERDAFTDRVERAELVMPFDGKLLTLHLKQKGNSYYKSGEVFAEVEDSGHMTAEIEVPESEAGFVELGSAVHLKPLAYSAEAFTGKVVHIDWNVTSQTFGNVIKVIAVFDNEDGRLKNGMTGYAKIDGCTLPVWQAFTQSVARFVQVQVWSWIP